MISFGPSAFAAAFAAGFVSFVSPCVLPLVPGYLSFLTGLDGDGDAAGRRRVVAATAMFVLGFTAMFVALGAGTAWFGGVLLSHRRWLEVAAGIFLILAGAVFAGLRLPMLAYREWRMHLGRSAGVATPAVAGVAFAVGWTPCIGPTLAAILALSAGNASPAQGAVLLAVYSLGLGLPFMAFGIWFTRALRVTSVLRRRAREIGIASGALLMVFGVLLATGQIGKLTAELARYTAISL